MRIASATYKGLITGAIMIVLSLVFYYGFHLPLKGYNQFVISGVYVAGILWSLISLKFASDGQAVFKEYFSEGFKTFIVVTLLMVVFTFIYYKLNPQILESVIKENDILAAKEANYTPKEIAENSEKLRNIFTPMTVAITTIKYLLLGVLVSVIGGISLARKS